jgi:hypothetical protein
MIAAHITASRRALSSEQSGLSFHVITNVDPQSSENVSYTNLSDAHNEITAQDLSPIGMQLEAFYVFPLSNFRPRLLRFQVTIAQISDHNRADFRP